MLWLQFQHASTCVGLFGMMCLSWSRHPPQVPFLGCVGWLWACNWIPEFVFQKVCVYLCMHLCTYLCLSVWTHVSKLFKWQKQPVLWGIKTEQSLKTDNLYLEGGFLFRVENQVDWLFTSFETAFPGVLFRCVLQLKNITVCLIGFQERLISLFWK